MDRVQAAHSGPRRELRGYLVRHRHLQPVIIATVRLNGLATALEVLNRVATQCSVSGIEAEPVRTFLTRHTPGQGDMR